MQNLLSSVDGGIITYRSEKIKVIELGMRQEREKQVLTSRQIEVLRLLAGGRTAKEVARMLDISVQTVYNRLANSGKPLSAYRVLGVQSKTQAVMEAIRRGYINPDKVEMQPRHEKGAIT